MLESLERGCGAHVDACCQGAATMATCVRQGYFQEAFAQGLCNRAGAEGLGDAGLAPVGCYIQDARYKLLQALHFARFRKIVTSAGPGSLPTDVERWRIFAAKAEVCVCVCVCA